MRENDNMVKTVEIVSLSSGIIGEPFVAHELRIGEERLKSMGLKVKYSSHTLKGIDYIKEHPEDRASDLVEAFADPEVDIILCAIGGDDTYRLLPFLFQDDRLKKVICEKIFLGFSDTTMNHFMLHKLGLKTFYGQSFLADLCELDNDMLPYSKKYFEELLRTGTIREICPSNVWYEERTSFDESQIGVPRISHKNNGYKLLQGPSAFSGKILGGCIDSIYDIFNNDRYEDSISLCEKYGLFDVLSGVLVGKPIDETYSTEYCDLLVKVIDKPELPILYNINIGHATPRCIIPFGVNAHVDAEQQVISFE